MFKYFAKKKKITPALLNKTLKLHNGKHLYELKISKSMIGFKIGQFVFTRVFKKK